MGATKTMELISVIFDSLRLFYFLEENALYDAPIITTIIIVVSVILFIAATFYLVFTTLKLKKDTTGMGDILGKETELAEVTETLKGCHGWVFINGENWVFYSKEHLKVGDRVKVIHYKGMRLEVEKTEEVL